MFNLYIFPLRTIKIEDDTGLRYIQWNIVTLHTDPIFRVHRKWKVYPDGQ